MNLLLSDPAFIASIASPAGAPLLLDTYTGAAAAYSLRQLRTGVTNVVRVRRSSDNTEQDFTAAQVTDGTLTAFCGAGDGFVRTWYDQSGNDRNMQQASSSNQPLLVTSGSVNTFNSKPAVSFNGSSQYFERITTTDQLYSFFGVHALVANEGTLNIIGSLVGIGPLASSAYGLGSFTANLSGESVLFFNGNSNSFLASSVPTTNNQPGLVSAHFGAGSLFVNGDGSNLIRSNHGLRTLDYMIGKRINLSQYNSKPIQELIMHGTDQSTNRAAIEANINAHYNIF